jgi:hypothetical protein
MGLFLLGFLAGAAATVIVCVVLYRLTPDDPADDPEPLGPIGYRPHHATGFDTADLDGQ